MCPACASRQGEGTGMEHRWERLTGPELKALAKRGALPVLPVGSLEQHGPHLPVWTDSAIAHAMCLAAAKLAEDVPAVVLPPLWTGLSEHHLPFGGTITVDHATFHALLRCVVRSLLACGFDRLLVVNGHGGNIEPLAVSARELAHEFAIPVVATSWPSVAPQAIGATLTTQAGVMHACEAETSLWLALDAAQVRADKLEEAFGANAPPAAPPGFGRFYSFEERAGRTGVRGDPRAATVEKGQAILAAVAEGLARAMRDPVLWTKPDDVWTPGRALRGGGV
ncbi:MAG: creatininase family protein [Acetobacteraceae bacterium]|nr:creatininase family protein [Acetobacteraceae bacterium]